MITLLIGLRSAVIILYLAKLIAWARVPEDTDLAARLRTRAWVCVSGGFVIFASPTSMARLLNHPFPVMLHNIMSAALMICLLAASMLWVAARGLTCGGTIRDVKRGAWLNIGVIATCILVAALAR